MSMNVGHSSSLQTLEQRNHSKSTVYSTDTDADSIGYASSSGTTTPEDDAKVFHLGPTLQSVLPEKSKPLRRAKPIVTTKHHNLSSAVKKVKKVAHALVVLKKKRSEDMSPSPLRERFGKRMAVKPHPDEVCGSESRESRTSDVELSAQGFYSLPNRRFSFSDVSTPSHQHHSETITRKFGTISGSTSSVVKESLRKQRSTPLIPSFSDPKRNAAPSSVPTPAAHRSEPRVLTLNTILIHMLRALLFLPWCVAVGGALLLFPSHVEFVAFGPGYLESPRGIRRFAHWAECGQQHVMIFTACLIAVLWYNVALGLSLTTIVVTRFVYVWHDFKVDKSIPLGEDDRQSLYLVVTGLASADGSFRVRGRDGETATETRDSARA